MGVPAANSQRRLSSTSPVGDALLQIANLELDFASDQLAAVSHDRDEAIHQCRKAFKRLRAIVRLGVAVPEVDPGSVDRRLRDAGRLLAPARDATTAAKVVSRLVDAEPTIAALKRISRPADNVDIPIAKVLRKVDNVRARLATLFASPETWTFARIADGIEATYSAAAMSMNKFEQANDDKRAHAWRKDVQRLLHQLGMIDSICSDLLGPKMRQLAEIADVLGEHHDLAVLRARLEKRRKKLPRKTARAVAVAAKTQQSELRQRALAIAGDCFAQSPRAFRDSLLASL